MAGQAVADTLYNFSRALSTLRKLRDRDAASYSELEMAGAIQRFEYTQELAWKLMKAILESRGYTRAILGSRDAIKAAFETRLIRDARLYHDMVDKRNLTSHTYNPEVATKIFEQIIPNYLPALEAFESTCRELAE